MRFLLDTNVISEIRKGARGHPNVHSWACALDLRVAFLSVVVIGEVRRGIERARRKDAAWASRIENWLQGLETDFAGRILPIDIDVANLWGRMDVGRSLPVADTWIAATAIVHDLVLVTRNVRDMRDTGARLLNPFEP